MRRQVALLFRDGATKMSTFVMSIGAFFPGISAVEMMMSTSFACLANNAISASINSFDITFAYPPAPSPDS